MDLRARLPQRQYLIAIVVLLIAAAAVSGFGVLRPQADGISDRIDADLLDGKHLANIDWPDVAMKQLDINISDISPADANLDLNNNNITNCSYINGLYCDNLSTNVTPGTLSIVSAADWEAGSPTFNATSEDNANNDGTLTLSYRNNSANLVGYWRLDESSGSIIDYSGNGNDGTASGFGSVRGAQGIFGTTAYDFNNDDDAGVRIPDSASLDLSDTNAVTVAAWIKVKGSPGPNWAHFAGKSDTTSSSNYGLVHDAGDSGINFRVMDSTDDDIRAEGNIPPTGEWQHVVGTYDGSTMRLYQDGVETATTSMTDGISDDNGDFQIGRHIDATDRYFNGVIDEVRVYDTALSAAEVKQLYRYGATRYQGEYTRDISEVNDQDWQTLQVTATIPTDTNVDARFQARDAGDSLVSEQVIDLSGGSTANYSLTVPDSPNARLIINGSTTNETKTWEVSDTKVFYEEVDTPAQDLASVLGNGNSAGTYDIDMEGNRILNVGNLGAIFKQGTFNTSEYDEGRTVIEQNSSKTYTLVRDYNNPDFGGIRGLAFLNEVGVAATVDDDVVLLNRDGAFPGSVEKYTFPSSRSTIAVAAGPDDTIYATSFGDEVVRLFPNLTEIYVYTGHTDSPKGLSVDPFNNAYTASEDGTVRKIGPDGTEKWSYTGHSTGGVDQLYLSPEGRIYTAGDNGEMHRLWYNKTVISTYSVGAENTQIESVVADLQGNVYMGLNDSRIRKIGPDNSVQWTVSLSGYGGIISEVDYIEIGPAGYIYGTGMNELLTKVSPSGDVIWAIDKGNEVDGLDIDSSGTIIIGDGVQFERYHQDGNDVDLSAVGNKELVPAK